MNDNSFIPEVGRGKSVEGLTDFYGRIIHSPTNNNKLEKEKDYKARKYSSVHFLFLCFLLFNHNCNMFNCACKRFISRFPFCKTSKVQVSLHN